MDSKDIVTEKSITFLESVFESMKCTPRHAYPISSLPYPKETMKKAVKKYVSSLDKRKFDPSLEHALGLRVIKGLYLSLADFMDDADAKFVNDVWNTDGNKPKLASDADRKHYNDIVDRAEKEREKMSTEIDVLIPPFNSINLLSFA